MRRVVTVVAVGVAALLFVPAMLDGASARRRRPKMVVTNADALTTRVRAELGVFTSWLRTNGVQGYIGEVGWPDDYRGESARWNALAEAWYRDADAAGLWATSWAAGEWWGSNYELSTYEDRSSSTPGVDSVNAQAAVVEAHPSAGYLRGVNDNGGEFGYAPTWQATSPFSNANPGSYESAYHYDSQATFNYLATRGVKLVRIPFRWERIQPTPGGALDPTELSRISDAVGRANTAGLRVVLDLHNYGAYYLFDGSQGVRRAIGSPEIPVETFARTWALLSQAFKGNPGIAGYGLMNEPSGLPSTSTLSASKLWENASQAALDAVRANGDDTLVFVPGYNWSGVQSWSTNHPSSWITDPASNFRYEAHHYFDRDNSGEYANTYAAEDENAKSRGYTSAAKQPRRAGR